MSSALFVAKREVVEFSALFYPRQPVFDNSDGTALQDPGHPFLFHSGSRFAGEEFIAKKFRELTRFEGLDGDLELPDRNGELPRAAEFDL